MKYKRLINIEVIVLKDKEPINHNLNRMCKDPQHICLGPHKAHTHTFVQESEARKSTAKSEAADNVHIQKLE